MSAVLGLSSVREQIIASVLEALNTNAPPDFPPCTRRRVEPYAPTDLPAFDLKRVKDEVSYEKESRLSMPFRKRVLTLRLTYSWSGDDGQDDVALVWATSQLDGQRLAPMIEDAIEAASEWAYTGLDAPYNAVFQDFKFIYHTLVGDQTNAGT